jgi:hypothetical protein
MTLPAQTNHTLSPIRPDDPANLGFPPMLPIELAMREAPVADICAAYGLSKADLEGLTLNPYFVAAYTNACDELKRGGGVSFKLKTQLQAEELIKVSYQMIKDKDTPSAVRADLIKSTVRWAGYEQKEGAAGVASAFQININLG